MLNEIIIRTFHPRLSRNRHFDYCNRGTTCRNNLRNDAENLMQSLTLRTVEDTVS